MFVLFLSLGLQMKFTFGQLYVTVPTFQKIENRENTLQDKMRDGSLTSKTTAEASPHSDVYLRISNTWDILARRRNLQSNRHIDVYSLTEMMHGQGM